MSASALSRGKEHHQLAVKLAESESYSNEQQPTTELDKSPEPAAKLGESHSEEQQQKTEVDEINWSEMPEETARKVRAMIDEKNKIIDELRGKKQISETRAKMLEDRTATQKGITHKASPAFAKKDTNAGEKGFPVAQSIKSKSKFEGKSDQSEIQLSAPITTSSRMTVKMETSEAADTLEIGQVSVATKREFFQTGKSKIYDLKIMIAKLIAYQFDLHCSLQS